MLYSIHNLTADIDHGCTSFGGFDCRAIIPLSDRKGFISENCGITRNEDWTAGSHEPIYKHHEFGNIYLDEKSMNFFVTSPDLVISYMQYLLGKEGPQTINVDYEHPFWAIHDIQHAIYDYAGCTGYVSAGIERERLIDAFKLMIEEKVEPEAEMLDEIASNFRSRFGESIDLEEFYPELLEDDEE